MNARIMADQVALTLGDCFADFDVDGIVSDIISQHGVLDINKLQSVDYYNIVASHDISERS